MDLGFTALELARIQFAFTVSFHIIFPATSIGLACFLAMLEWKWLRTQNPIYKDLFKFWIKIFAVAFGMGCLLYTSPSPRDVEESRMPSSA